MNQIGQYVQDGQIVFNDDDALGFSKVLNDSYDAHSLVNIKVGRRFVEKVDVDVPKDGGTDGHALEFSSRELLNGSLKQVVDAQRTGGLLKQASLVHLTEKFVNGSFDALGEFIHVLRLEGDTNAAFLNGDEKITKFAFREGSDHALPIGLLVEPITKVWRHTA